MPELRVTRHIVKPHQPHGGEDYDPSQDMLIVVHRNPANPEDPAEFGHHIRMQGLAYRKEMWGLPDYASTLDVELRDLARYYLRENGETLGVHPLAGITEHYFEAPPVHMQSFAPDYIMDRPTFSGVIPGTTDGVMRMCVDVVLSGVDDVKTSLASTQGRRFPCRGMTALSTDSAKMRSETMQKMEQQSKRLELTPSAPLDEVRQMLTDRTSALDGAREAFVNHALMESGVPEIMRRRVADAAVKRGILGGDVWI